MRIRLQGYKDAAASGKDSLCDFMIDRYLDGRKKVAEIFGVEEAKKLKSVKAEDAIEAIKQGKFDFVEGSIIE